MSSLFYEYASFRMFIGPLTVVVHVRGCPSHDQSVATEYTESVGRLLVKVARALGRVQRTYDRGEQV